MVENNIQQTREQIKGYYGQVKQALKSVPYATTMEIRRTQRPLMARIVRGQKEAVREQIRGEEQKVKKYEQEFEEYVVKTQPEEAKPEYKEPVIAELSGVMETKVAKESQDVVNMQERINKLYEDIANTSDPDKVEGYNRTLERLQKRMEREQLESNLAKSQQKLLETDPNAFLKQYYSGELGYESRKQLAELKTQQRLERIKETQPKEYRAELFIPFGTTPPPSPTMTYGYTATPIGKVYDYEKNILAKQYIKRQQEVAMSKYEPFVAQKLQAPENIFERIPYEVSRTFTEALPFKAEVLVTPIIGVSPITILPKGIISRAAERVPYTKRVPPKYVPFETYGELADIGTYAIPYFGGARFFGTDVPATVSKVVRKKYVSPLEVGIAAVGVGVGAGFLATKVKPSMLPLAVQKRLKIIQEELKVAGKELKKPFGVDIEKRIKLVQKRKALQREIKQIEREQVYREAQRVVLEREQKLLRKGRDLTTKETSPLFFRVEQPYIPEITVFFKDPKMMLRGMKPKPVTDVSGFFKRVMKEPKYEPLKIKREILPPGEMLGLGVKQVGKGVLLGFKRTKQMIQQAKKQKALQKEVRQLEIEQTKREAQRVVLERERKALRKGKELGIDETAKLFTGLEKPYVPEITVFFKDVRMGLRGLKAKPQIRKELFDFITPKQPKYRQEIIKVTPISPFKRLKEPLQPLLTQWGKKVKEIKLLRSLKKGVREKTFRDIYGGKVVGALTPKKALERMKLLQRKGVEDTKPLFKFMEKPYKALEPTSPTAYRPKVLDLSLRRFKKLKEKKLDERIKPIIIDQKGYQIKILPTFVPKEKRKLFRTWGDIFIKRKQIRILKEKTKKIQEKRRKLFEEPKVPKGYKEVVTKKGMVVLQKIKTKVKKVPKQILKTTPISITPKPTTTTAEAQLVRRKVRPLYYMESKEEQLQRIKQRQEVFLLPKMEEQISPVITKPSQIQRQQQRIRQIQRPIEITRPRPIEITKPQPIYPPIMKIPSITITKQPQTYKTRQISLKVPKPKIRALKVPIKIPKKVPRKIPKRLRKQIAYRILIKRFGKEKVLTKKPLPLGRALKLGAGYVRRTLGATFKVEKEGFTEIPDIQFKPSEQIFRRYKIRKGKKIPLEKTWIQRRKYRLSTRPEVTEIQVAKRSGGIRWV